MTLFLKIITETSGVFFYISLLVHTHTGPKSDGPWVRTGTERKENGTRIEEM